MLVVAQAKQDSSIRHSVLWLEFWWLWIGLVALGIVLVWLVVVMGKRRRLLTRAGEGPKKPRAIKDAWSEAGKRAEPLPMDEPVDEEEP